MSVWKGHFSVFCKFLSDEVETVFWESEAKRSKLFKSKFAYMDFLENGFGAILSSKTNVWTFEKSIFQFFANLWVTKMKLFSGKARQCCKTFLDKVYLVESFSENIFKSLFDHSRQSLLEFLTILNVLNVSIWIFNWS